MCHHLRDQPIFIDLFCTFPQFKVLFSFFFVVAFIDIQTLGLKQRWDKNRLLVTYCLFVFLPVCLDKNRLLFNFCLFLCPGKIRFLFNLSLFVILVEGTYSSPPFACFPQIPAEASPALHLITDTSDER